MLDESFDVAADFGTVFGADRKEFPRIHYFGTKGGIARN